MWSTSRTQVVVESRQPLSGRATVTGLGCKQHWNLSKCRTISESNKTIRAGYNSTTQQLSGTGSGFKSGVLRFRHQRDLNVQLVWSRSHSKGLGLGPTKYWVSVS